MITLNKSMTILPQEEMIKKLEETRIQRMHQFRDLNQYIGSNTTSSNQEKNENERPILELKELENTAVHISTQESYDTLMQIYEIGKWEWPDNTPTEHNFWKSYKQQTCIPIKNRFRYGNKEFYIKKNWRILTPKEFYEIQKPEITPKMIKEINQLFEVNKPNRKSKG